MKKFFIISGITILSIIISGCSNKEKEHKVENKTEKKVENNTEKNVNKNESYLNGDFSNLKIGMVADIVGVNDQSFNQSAWEYLEKFREESNAKVTCIEPKQRSQYESSLEKLTDNGNDIIWGIGILFADDIKKVALKNPEQMYGIVDYDYDGNVPKNVVAIMFEDNSSSFLIGYMAAKTTKTNKVGFIGGIKCIPVERFEYGFRSGVAYAEKELGKKIEVVSEYINTFSDDALAKAKALVFYGNNVDIIFHAAGTAGAGVIEAAKDTKKLVCGVDRDQSYLAPDNVMVSALKLVGSAMLDVSKRIAMGEKLCGQAVYYGFDKNGVSITKYEESTAKLVDKKVYDDTIKLIDIIKSKKIIVPKNEKEFLEFKENFKQ